MPEYKEDDATHFAYLGDFIKEISKQFDVYLIVEKGVLPPPDWGYKKVRKLFFSFVPLRFLELFLLASFARMVRYKDFYVHYAFDGALVTSVIVRLFGGRVFYWNCGEPWKYKRNFLREMWEKKVYKLITYLVTGTEKLAMQYSSHYGIPMAKIKVMPNWINLTKAQKHESTRTKKQELNVGEIQKVLLFVHRLSERKGASYLPEILRELREENIVLIVAGDGPERAKIESRVKTYELENKIRFLGWVPQGETVKYYAIADVLVMPSNEEGFPHVLLEAMAAGVPFVASDVGSVAEIVPVSMRSYVVSPGNVKDFAVKIKELLTKDRSALEILSSELLEFVKKYDIKYAVEVFKKIIND